MGGRPAWRRPHLGDGIGVARLSPARRVALGLLGSRRRRDARIRDLARDDAAFDALSPADRALAYRLAVGATAAATTLDSLIDARVKKPGSLEPRVRDALQIAVYEACYLDTPAAVSASQGVELVRSVAPRAAGLANAVLRRIASEVRPQVDEAYRRVVAGGADPDDLALASALPSWLLRRVLADRGPSLARGLALSQLQPAPVCVAANGLRHDAASLEALLAREGLEPSAVDCLPGSFALGAPAGLARTGLVTSADVVVADQSAQLVCRIAAPPVPGDLLEVGQGRGTKSILLATAVGAVHPTHVAAVDSVPYKVRLSRRRMEAAGLAEVVTCHELDGCRLADDGLPAALDRAFGTVLVDAPCSGSGTLRRHPEIASSLSASDVSSLAPLQSRLLAAAAARVAPGGTLVYSTCSVLREEDEAVVEAFLASEAGQGFAVEPVTQTPACRACAGLAQAVGMHQTPEGYLLVSPAPDRGDGHFCASLVRSGHPQ